jgi:uncharacterized glyoxalase superfamily protein PhnB
MSKPNIFPAMRYANAPDAIDWLVRAFGFKKGGVVAGNDGTIAHAELSIGTGMIMLSSARKPSPDDPWSSVPQGVYVSVADPDAHYARAKAARAEITVPLKDMEYGSREYSARDLEGHLWGFGTYNPSTEGTPDVTPLLRYTNGTAAIAWLRDAFGFETKLEVPGADGTIAHAELRLGAGYIMLGSTPEDSKDNPWAGQKQGVCVALDAVDAHYARAKAAGAAILRDIADTPYGTRGYSALDLEGRVWTFGTYRP